jgi:uracil-DNA glycosylase
VSATARNVNATDIDGLAALPYLRGFVTLLADLRVVVVMGSFARRWWFRYLTCYPGSRVPYCSAPPRVAR